MIDYEKITAVMQMQDFSEKVKNCKEMDDFRRLFGEFDVTLTESETVELISQIAERQQKVQDGELIEEELDTVAGGVVISTTLFCIAVGTACCGTGALAAYVAYQKLKFGK